MKNLIKKVIPKSVFNIRLQMLAIKNMNEQINQDKKRFKQYSFDNKKLSYNQMEARLTKAYHSIEKGLSYPDIRLGFGKLVLEDIISLMKDYRNEKYPLDSHVYKTALSTLNEYISYHKEHNFDVNKLEQEYELLEKGVDISDTGGIFRVNKKDILEKTTQDFEQFSKSRYSIRTYSNEPVTDEVVEKAIQLATETPSACNRQPWRVRVVGQSELKKYIQNNQNGNRGFGDYIDKYIIITTNVEYYDKGRERNQANIDGGMYAMNLLYSFHYYGVATIPLSASLTIKQEENLREKFDIPESENFIMFIGLGNYPDEFKVTKSDRRGGKYIKF